MANTKKNQIKGKVLVQFNKLIRNEDFISEVKELRHKVGLPIEGISTTEEDRKNIWNRDYKPSNFDARTEDPDTRFHEVFHQPMRYFNRLIEDLSVYIPTKDTKTMALLRGYVLYDILVLQTINGFDVSEGVCEIDEAEEEFLRYGTHEGIEGSGLDSNTRRHNDSIWEDTHRFPIVLRIHPDAGQRDITDYVKDNWQLIDELREKYKTEKIY